MKLNLTVLSPASAAVIPGANSVAGLIECMRPVQWIKNGFVLAPMVFSNKLTDVGLDLMAVGAFAAFCGAASAVYLWNDSLDWRSDAHHPEKCTRPIPSGRLSPGLAASFGFLLAGSAVAGGFLLNPLTGWLVFAYTALNVLYSLWLKNVVIVDLMCIAIGFVLRVTVGSAAIGVEPSHWLLMCTLLLALFLAVAKRRQELVTLAAKSGQHRRVLAAYSLPWLDQAATIAGGSAVVSYALYAVSAETLSHFGTSKLIYTLPFVLFGVLRYLYLAHAGSSTGNPTNALIADRQLLLCVMGWVTACVAIIYR